MADALLGLFGAMSGFGNAVADISRDERKELAERLKMEAQQAFQEKMEGKRQEFESGQNKEKRVADAENLATELMSRESQNRVSLESKERTSEKSLKSAEKRNQDTIDAAAARLEKEQAGANARNAATIAGEKERAQMTIDAKSGMFGKLPAGYKEMAASKGKQADNIEKFLLEKGDLLDPSILTEKRKQIDKLRKEQAYYLGQGPMPMAQEQDGGELTATQLLGGGNPVKTPDQQQKQIQPQQQKSQIQTDRKSSPDSVSRLNLVTDIPNLLFPGKNTNSMAGRKDIFPVDELSAQRIPTYDQAIEMFKSGQITEDEYINILKQIQSVNNPKIFSGKR